jgi:hypothetical protein
MEEMSRLQPRAEDENNRLLGLKNRLQVEIAKALFPEKDTRAAIWEYINRRDPYDLSKGLREILEDEPQWYGRLENDFEGSVVKFLVILKERVGYKE